MEQEVQVRFPEEIQGGVYTNNMMVAHTKEEFVIDFMMVAPPVGTVTARVIVSPGHMKRMIAALKENIDKYEQAFKKIKEAPEPPKPKIGF